MDPADASQLQHVVSSQGALLAQHDHRMRRIEEALDRNSQQLSQVADTLWVQCSMSASSAEPAPPPQPPTAPAVRESYVPPPEPFSGDLDKCRGFLLQCRLVFAQQPQTYASDAAKGFRSVADFSVEFRVLATEAQWDDAALQTVFRHGLSDPVKDELTNRDPPDSLDELIELAIRLDNRIRERRRERGQIPASVPQGLRTPPLKSLVSPVSSASASSELPAEPMELARARLSPTERQRRLQAGRLGALMSGAVFPDNPQTRLTVSTTLSYQSVSLPLLALVDSGAEHSLLDASLAKQWSLPLIPLDQPLKVRTLDGSVVTEISHKTAPLHLLVSGNHQEDMSFFLMHSPDNPLVLGYSWLRKHNPHIDWFSNKIIGWGIPCHNSCLLSAAFLGRHSPPVDTSPTPDMSLIPPAYHDLAPVFNKEQALSLPPHRPFDCAIDLQPGAPLPTGRLYNLSHPEREAMEKYIRESLQAGLIRPSSSPVAAGFFFVSKKDKTLRPCIDYRGLNNITVKNRYPLPLLNSAFESLQGATIFTKLDLRNAYHLV
ncbi:hypothetical protein Q8A73_021639 [Channa argus]|nr:hypothetical protein Q8A73_021639 [Channa argus]